LRLPPPHSTLFAMKTCFFKVLMPVFACGCAILFSGCALLFGKRFEEVQIQSDPSGAKVYQDGVYQGETPISLVYDRQDAPLVVLEKEGFAPTQLQIRRGLNNLGKLDAVFCWTIVPLFDFREYGRMLKYKESAVFVPLQTEEMIRDRKANFNTQMKNQINEKPSKSGKGKQKTNFNKQMKRQGIGKDGSIWINKNVLLSPYNAPREKSNATK